jgi:hypothetical protein
MASQFSPWGDLLLCPRDRFCSGEDPAPGGRSPDRMEVSSGDGQATRGMEGHRTGWKSAVGMVRLPGGWKVTGPDGSQQ